MTRYLLGCLGTAAKRVVCRVRHHRWLWCGSGRVCRRCYLYEDYGHATG
jgi:hypothetical protein